jgi:hypothetical protein
MIGILLCLNQGIPLKQCQFFIDLTLAETKEERVKRIFIDAMDDWTSPSRGDARNLGARAGTADCRHSVPYPPKCHQSASP